jgi:hypothetical protein
VSELQCELAHKGVYAVSRRHKSWVCWALHTAGWLRGDVSLCSLAVSTLVSAAMHAVNAHANAAANMAAQVHAVLMQLLRNQPAATKLPSSILCVAVSKVPQVLLLRFPARRVQPITVPGNAQSSESSEERNVRIQEEERRRQRYTNEADAQPDPHVKRQEPTGSLVLGATKREEAIRELIAMLCRPGDPDVRLGAAHALQTISKSTLQLSVLLSEQIWRPKQGSAADCLTDVAEPVDESTQVVCVQVRVSDNAVNPVAITLSIEESTSGWSLHRISGKDLSPSSIDLSPNAPASEHEASELPISELQAAAIAASAADAVSDESPTVAAAASQLLQQLAAPAAVIASDPRMAAALGQSKWRLQA